jgi:zinc protease
MRSARKSRAAGKATRFRHMSALGALLLLLPAAALAQRATLEKVIKRTVLPNGLEIIVLENHGVPLATIEIDVRNGAFTQEPGFEGLAHMYEHMFFKANGDYPEPEEFVERAGELGAIFNGTTSEERVNYYLTLPSDSLAGGMKFIAAALRRPLFRQDELERERAVVIGEYDRQESSPFLSLLHSTGKVLWGSSWSRKNALGERAAILATTPEKLRAIQKKYYVPNNTVVIVSGDVVPDSVFRYARETFGDWARGEDPFKDDPIPPVQPLTASRGMVIEEPIGAVIVLMQWHGPSVGKDPQATYAADVFSDVLNQPNSGFQQRLVDSGLFQSVGVNYYTLNQVGPISISGQTTPERLKEAVAALEKEIARFTEPGYFTTAQLEPVKRQRLVGTAFGVERASSLSHTIGFWWSVASLEYYMGYVDNMASQTPADLQDYARRYIVGKPRVTGVMIDPRARAQIRLQESDLMPAGVSR